MRLLRLLLAVLSVLPSVSSANVRAARVVVPQIGAPAPLPLLGVNGLSLTAPSVSATLQPTLTPTSLASPPVAVATPHIPVAVGATPPLAASPATGIAAASDAPGIPGLPRLPEDTGDPRAPKLSARELLLRIGRPSFDRAAALLAQAFDGRGRAVASDGSVFEVQPDLAVPGQIRIVRVAPPPSVAPISVPGTEGLSGRALLEALGRITARGQRTHEYADASDHLFSTTDNVVIGGVRGVVDGYSGVFVAGTSSEGRDYPEPGDRNRDGHIDEGMNVEHIWPQGHFDKKLPMRSDLHHLMATFIHPNGVRANHPFGVVSGRPTYSNDAGTKSNGSVFEPADFSKGRVARAMLYFYSRYRGQAIFANGGPRWWDQQIELLLDWNRRYPPDAGERARNDLVERFQGNRNPFVDDPSLADRVGPETWRPASPRAKAGQGRSLRRRPPSSARRH